MNEEDITSCVVEITPGLFLGSLRSLGLLKSLGVTHVVSVVNFEVAKDLSAYRHLHLALPDDEDANLLALLPQAYTFINDCLQGPSPGRVLVHCQAGQSRSVATVAAYLMKAQGLTADKAVASIQALWPSAQPNEGFLAQLLLFQDMRCSLDPQHPVFRLWCHRQVGQRWEESGWAEPEVFAQLPTLQETQAQGCTLYRCRKCRQVLASSAQVLPLDEASLGHKLLGSRKHHRLAAAPAGQGQAGGGAGAAPSLFVSPLAWMAGSVVGEVQGKLYCPGCKERLGSFNWAGITNERGAWITPAFQLHCSKLDTVLPHRALHSGRVLPTQRRPPPQLQSPQQQQEVQEAHSCEQEKQLEQLGVQLQERAVLGGGPPVGQLASRGMLEAGAGVNHPAASAPDPPPSPAPVALPHAAPPSADTVDSTLTRAPGSPCLVASHAVPPYPAAQLSPGQLGSGQGLACPPPACRTAWFSCLLLDCDGVMVDSERCSCEALRRAILQVTGFDIPHSFPNDFYPVFGMDVRSCLEHYRAAHGRLEWADLPALTLAVTAAKEEHYQQLTDEAGISAFEGAADLIQAARALGMSVAVASSGAPQKLARNLQLSGLLPLLDPYHVVSAAYVARGKPAPDVYLEAMRRVGCSDPTRALVVEDAVNGLKAGRAAGAFTVAVPTSLPAEVLRPWADLVVERLGLICLDTLTPAAGARDAAAPVPSTSQEGEP